MKHIYLKVFIGLWLSCWALSSVAQTTSGIKKKNTKVEQVSDITLFPNPASDRFTINIESGTIKYITINNIIGKEVKKVFANPSNSFEVGELKRGVYIIRIFDPNDEMIKALRLSKT